MYNRLRSLTSSQQIELLTKELVKTQSITGSVGEANIANKIKVWIQSFPYFQQNPDYIWEQPIPNDPYERKNIFALIKNNHGKKQTIVYHSHIDTVGVEDYGSLAKNAFDPDELLAFFTSQDHNLEVKEDAQSGNWLFGRGSLDMKSGNAIHIANLLYFSENLEELSGNLLVMFNPDEETQHCGVLNSISELNRLKHKYGFEYICAINNDFTSPLYDGDSNRYIYTGFAGKVLPCFYIYGREVHVGETLKGIDSTLIASEINRKINNNMDLAEKITNEVILPPSSLYQRDYKDAYSVQTPFKTGLYFNYFLYDETPSDCLNKLKAKAIEACKTIQIYLKENYRIYETKTSHSHSAINWEIEVVTIEEYLAQLKQKKIDIQPLIKHIVKENSHLDVRDISLKVVDALQELDVEKRPRVILFFAPPYCPNHSVNRNGTYSHYIQLSINDILEDYKDDLDNKFQVKEFFPFLADSSYISLQESEEELASLLRNFPGWGEIYSLPLNSIRDLNISAINLGVYGKDGHKWTERVYKPYSFGVLPKLIRNVTIRLLQQLDIKGLEYKKSSGQG